MIGKLKWETDFEAALERAKSENKKVLLDFYNPGWIGCNQMDAVTYPNDDVAGFMNEKMVPVRVSYDSEPHAKDFNLKWTPTLVTLDPDGKEHHRTLGFLAPEELIPSLILGMAKADYENDRYEEAIEEFDRVLSEYPRSDAAPEALFLMGVSSFKKDHEAKHLKEAYERLKAEYPSNQWTKRAEPYQVL